MKGRVSPHLEAVLKDPKGREQLVNRLLKGQDGSIRSGDKQYVLTVDVTTSARTKPTKG